jgi:deoxyribose-phosphate aldolase
MISDLPKYIEHTIVNPNSTEKDVERVVKEVLKYGFRSICVLPNYVKKASEMLKNKARVVTVVGFPFGVQSIEAKVLETQHAVADGATDIDMVMNRSMLKNKEYGYVKREVAEVIKASKGAIVKVIIETPDLTKREIKTACKLIKEVGADYVKTGTGFRGPTKLEDVKFIRKNFPDLPIKASGGIRTYRQAVRFLKAGANLIGSSHGVKIIRG